MVWGSPGVGKSQIVAQVCQELGRNVLDIRLAYYQPYELTGLLVVLDGQPTEVPPSFLVDFVDAGNGVLLFDEINAAPRTTQVAAYQLITNRGIGTALRLDNDTAIVAAGNLSTDKAVVHTMPTPLVNRMMHLKVVVDYEDWRTYEIGVGVVDHTILAFLSQYPQHLFTLNMNTPDNTPFATPRAWEEVGHYLTRPGLNELLRERAISGLVGTGVAADFFAFRKLIGVIPTVSEFLAGAGFPRLDDEAMGGGIALLSAVTLRLVAEYRDHPTKRKKVDPTFKRFAASVTTRLTRGDVHPEYLAYFLADLTPHAGVWGALEEAPEFGKLAALIQEEAV